MFFSIVFTISFSLFFLILFSSFYSFPFCFLLDWLHFLLSCIHFPSSPYSLSLEYILYTVLPFSSILARKPASPSFPSSNFLLIVNVGFILLNNFPWFLSNSYSIPLHLFFFISSSNHPLHRGSIFFHISFSFFPFNFLLQDINVEFALFDTFFYPPPVPIQFTYMYFLSPYSTSQTIFYIVIPFSSMPTCKPTSPSFLPSNLLLIMLQSTYNFILQRSSISFHFPLNSPMIIFSIIILLTCTMKCKLTCSCSCLAPSSFPLLLLGEGQHS